MSFDFIVGVLLVESCEECPFKDEYYGFPDYWMCDEENKKIDDLKIIPEWCPWRKKDA